MTDPRPSAEAVSVAQSPLRQTARALANDRRIRYIFAGGVAAMVYYAVFTLGWLMLSRAIPYLVMVVIANILTALMVYPLYRNVVWQVKVAWWPGFLRFYVTSLWSLVIGLIGLPLLVEVAGLHVLLALPIVIAAAPLINYQAHKFWAFRERGGRAL